MAVAAPGGDSAAGIGGSDSGGDVDAPGEYITINGGTVTATGGDFAAGIGGGGSTAGKHITISGGMVTATGGSYGGAGIGGGSYAMGSDITISGGTVVANGGLHILLPEKARVLVAGTVVQRKTSSLRIGWPSRRIATIRRRRRFCTRARRRISPVRFTASAMRR